MSLLDNTSNERPFSSSLSVMSDGENPTGIVIRTFVGRDAGVTTRSQAAGYQQLITAVTSVPPGTKTICSKCTHGGTLVVCQGCETYTICIDDNSRKGCLSKPPSGTFRCIGCRRNPASPEKHRATNTNMSPLVLFNVVFDPENGAGDRHGAGPMVTGAQVVAAQCEGYFAGQPENCLHVICQFEDLKSPMTINRLKAIEADVKAFVISKLGNVRLLLVITTHASLSDGGLSFSTRETTTINEVVRHVLRTIQVKSFTNSVLIVNTCGGFMNHSLTDFQNMSKSFSSVLASGGGSVDPLQVATRGIQTLVQYHIFRDEPVMDAARRMAQSLATECHTFLSTKQKTWQFTNAHPERRPAGRRVTCLAPLCQMSPRRTSTHSTHTVFRCRHSPEIEGGQNQTILLKSDDEEKRFFFGTGDTRMLSSLITSQVDIILD